MVLSDEYCGLIEEKIADNCRIASCKNDERVHLTDHETFIPEGAICRLKCKGAKATRCRCCSSGFAVSIELHFAFCLEMYLLNIFRTGIVLSEGTVFTV